MQPSASKPLSPSAPGQRLAMFLFFHAVSSPVSLSSVACGFLVRSASPCRLQLPQSIQRALSVVLTVLCLFFLAYRPAHSRRHGRRKSLPLGLHLHLRRFQVCGRQRSCAARPLCRHGLLHQPLDCAPHNLRHLRRVRSEYVGPPQSLPLWRLRQPRLPSAPPLPQPANLFACV